MMYGQLLWADWLILGIVGLSMLMSLWRGFMREVISLTTWVAAFFIAFNFSGPAAELLVSHVAVPSVRSILAFGATFVATLFAGGILNLIVGMLIDNTGLTTTDRIVGLLFGALRGVAIVLILVVLAGMTPLPRDPWWGQSLFLPRVQALAVSLRGYLPPELARQMLFGQALLDGLSMPAPQIPLSPAPPPTAAPQPGGARL